MSRFVSLCALCCALFVLPMNAIAQDASAGAQEAVEVKALEYLEKVALRLVHDWRSRQATIRKVKTIKRLSGPVTAKETKDQLEARLTTLLTKSRSNRQWKTYWDMEQKAANVLELVYQVLLEKGSLGKGMPSWVNKDDNWKTLPANVQATIRSGLVLNRALNGLKSRATGTEAARLKADQAFETAKTVHLRHTRAVKSALALRMNEVAKLDVDKLRVKAKRLASELKKLEAVGTTDDEAKAKLLKRVALLQQELAKVEVGITVFSDAAALHDAQKGTLTQSESADYYLRKGVSKSTQVLLNAFLKSEGSLMDQQTSAKVAKRAADKARFRLEVMRAHRTGYEARRALLVRWARLGAAKKKNQDVYFAALQADEKAVVERLKGFKDVKEDTDTDGADAICAGKLEDGETTLERYNKCVNTTEQVLRGLKGKRSQLEATLDLSRKLYKSTAALLNAQKTDVTLVEDEFGISKHAHKQAEASDKVLALQLKRAGQDVGESADAGGWGALWQGFSSRAKLKVTQLRDAVLDTKETRQTLQVNMDLYNQMLSNVEGKTDEKGEVTPPGSILVVEQQLAQRKGFGKLVVAVLASGWELIRIGWPALIYLFLAFLLVKLTNRISNRLVERAKDSTDDEDDGEIKKLERLLEEAIGADNTDRINELRDQITLLESRRRDLAQRVETLTNVGRGAVKLVIYVAVSLLVLDALTVDIGPILGGAAIFGLAISFGSQSLVKDVVTGFFILLENQYAVGDAVTINGEAGSVEKITLRRTVLRNLSGGVINIPNGAISQVTNKTQGWARAVVAIGVAYDANLDEVAEIMNQVGDEMYADPQWNSRIMEAPRYGGITGFNASDVGVRAMFKTHTFEHWGAQREYSYRLKKAFDSAGIEIPYPKQDLHIVSGLENVLAGDTGSKSSS
jgi:small-conductance mechanosensitive channel